MSAITERPPYVCTIGYVQGFPGDGNANTYLDSALASIPRPKTEAEGGPVYRRGYLCVVTSEQSMAMKRLEELGWKLIASVPSGHNGHSGYKQGTWCHLYACGEWVLAGETLPPVPKEGHY